MKIIREIEKAGGIVSYEELKSLGISRQLIRYYIRRGELVRISRGIYAIPEKLNPYLLAKHLSPGYVSFYSALYYYRLVDAPPFTITIATFNTSRKFEKFGFEFKEVALGKRFCGYIDKKDARVARRAKAFYDSFRKPDLGGGYPLILRALYEAKLSDEEWREFLDYVKRFEKSAFMQRVGYLLSVINIAPSFVLDFFKSKVKSYVYLDPRKRGGKLVREWKVIDNIGKGVLLSWMKG